VTRPILRPEAEQDLANACDWYDQQHPGLGDELLGEIDAAFERLASMPKLYAILHEDVRACRLRRFPFLIYYRALAGRVEVLAVLHGSRDESAWQSRL
jgi:plasmid stabilization system protein ParE